MNKKLLLSLGLLSLGVSTSVYSEHKADHKSVDHKEKKDHDHSFKTAIKKLKVSLSSDWQKYQELLNAKLESSNWAGYSKWHSLQKQIDDYMDKLKPLLREITNLENDPAFKKAQREVRKEVFGDKVDDFKRKAKKAYKKGEKAVKEGARKVKKGAEDLAHKAKQAAADAAQKAADALK